MRESIDIGILTTDKNLNITYWNSWLEEKTGLLSKEVLGKIYWNYFLSWRKLK